MSAQEKLAEAREHLAFLINERANEKEIKRVRTVVSWWAQEVERLARGGA